MGRVIWGRRAIVMRGSPTRPPSQRLFARARFLGVMLTETPRFVAFWRVAASVRLSAFAIFAAGSLRAMPLRRRTSSFVQGRLAGAFFDRATALAMCPPVCRVSFANPFCMNCNRVQRLQIAMSVLRRPSNGQRSLRVPFRVCDMSRHERPFADQSAGTQDDHRRQEHADRHEAQRRCARLVGRRNHIADDEARNGP
jgi:hypothetical protein